MFIQTLRSRFLWRLRAPIGPEEIRRVERWLATARVFLAVSALVAIQMDPGELRYSVWAYGLLAFFIAHRLRTVQRADDILILEGGRVVEYGSRVALAADHRSRFYQLLQTGMEEALA